MGVFGRVYGRLAPLFFLWHTGERKWSMASTVKVMRWLQSWLPTEAGLRRSMLAQGLQPYRWSNGPGDTYPPHSHPYHKVILVVEGSITFGLPEEGG